MESITKLFGDLCEAHIVSVSTKVHLNKRKSSKKISRKSLKKIAYNTLFANLFLDETRKVSQSSFSRLPVKNKMLMLSFNLRVAGLSLEADRLEQLVEELEKSTCLPFTEITSILDFLIQLAGTGPPHCSPLKKDYFVNNKYVGRNTKYQGYDYYDVSIFEADVQAFIANEELQCNDTIQKTLQIMEAAPGTGLPMVELFSQNCSMGDRYERETRVSLFGALIHSRTCDMDIKLDLPPVPDNADLSGLAIKVPQSIDPSEDEGFQSASNLTPDSQSEPSVTPDLDLWEAALTYGPSKRRCWERIGFPPGKKEEPYLSEAGREAFDKFCRLREQELQLFSSTKFQFPQRVLVKEPEIVKDVLNVLIGVVSTSFSFNQAVQIFVVKQGIYVSGTSPESMNCLLSEVAEYGTYYTRLSRFSVQPVLDSSYKKGLVFQAFTSGLRKYLHYYRACVLSTPLTLTLLTISFLFRKLGRQLRYLAELCGIGTTAVGAGGGTSASFPTGVELLSYLYQETLNNCSSEHYPVLLSLLKTSCEPYTRFIHDWVYSGVFRDVYGEFMIQVNEDYLGFRDKHYWTHGYVLISKEVEDCVPVFLKHIANDVYICGKTINLLKLCCPRHYICWSDIPVPRISVTFSLDELKEIEKDCAVYVGRMERIARYSTVSKEEKVLRMEIEKQRLIAHAQEAASKALKAITDQQISEKMALDVKKREQFQKLKEQFVKEQERRRTLKQEEIDDDFSYARELREREKRLKALEEDLEKRARQELIDHYTKLSEDAARREKKALWKIQRHKLEAARLDFLLKDKKKIEDMLEKLPGGKYRKKVNIIPEDQSQQVMLAVGQRRDANLQSDHQKIMDMERDTKSELTNYISKDQSLELTQPLNMQPTDCSESEEAAVASQTACGDQMATLSKGMSELGLNFEDFLPKPQEEILQTTQQTNLLDEALESINSELSLSDQRKESNSLPKEATEGETVFPASLDDEYDFNTVLRPSISQSHIQVGENVFHVESRRPRWNIHGHVSDASIKIGGYIPHNEPSQPHSNPHGHSSDAHIKVGEYASEEQPHRPRWNIHGHVSIAHIPVGGYASEVEVSRPRWNIHGHASDANIKIGEYVPKVETTRTRWNTQGDIVDTNICPGENEGLSSRPRWNVHGHASESHFKIGELVLDSESSKPRWSAFGHVSRSSIQLGKWTPSTDSDPIPHFKSGFGSASSCTVQTFLYSGEISDEKGEEQETRPPDIGLANLDKIQEESFGEEEPVSQDDTEDLQSFLVEEPEKSTSLSVVTQQTSVSEVILSENQERGSTSVAIWKKEEADYLRALSNQYRLEKYQDQYEFMSELPVSHLLHHMIPRSYTFPVDPTIQSATDETAVQLSELLSLPVLMKRSITTPLVSHVSLVNKAIVDYYFVELNVEKHFEALRHFLLMEDGEFAQSLSDLLFEKLGTGQTPGELLNPLVLNSILNKALQYSLHGDSHLASNLSFALKYLPDMFKPNAPDALTCLDLRYKVDWPLNIVITENCMNKYNKIFSFLLQLKHMVWTLKDVWFHLKRTALVKHASNSVQFRQLQLYKHEMQHFVKVIQGYIANQILHVTWCEFGNKLSSVGNLEEIYRTHAEYLNKAIFRGLLTEKAAPVMNIIHSIFSLILKFRSQLISQSWNFDSSKHVAVHPNFGLMQQSYNTFKYYSHFLFNVVTKLVNRGYQPHLEDFLLRINFNNYYKDN
ncbi:gamma-tubulin complex component 6 isoform X2 [Pseudonaja textilis]|uniref:gamma-tubulin complex component 6 isoform X2 n=1 Tax=Pseudonaja textilis TaxID=8673 RepID=UPI000EA921B0|nr:gamma-tubulin complex component 6 isoform X2 [Pseudonaja textilis]